MALAGLVRVGSVTVALAAARAGVGDGAGDGAGETCARKTPWQLSRDFGATMWLQVGGVDVWRLGLKISCIAEVPFLT